MALSDAKVRNAKPGAKPYKITDGDGLYLLVKPSGAKYWRYKYHFERKERLLALGVYPAVTLNSARAKRLEASQSLASGIDPAEKRHEAKRQQERNAHNSFETIAREWHEKRKGRWKPNTTRIHLMRLEQYAFPVLGKKPISQIKAPALLDMLLVIERKGALETTRRVLQDCVKIFTFAIATARAEHNPALGLEDALKTPIAKSHAHLKANELPKFYDNLNAADLAPLTKLAMRLLILTFVRTTELRAAQWDEMDFKKTEWRIPPERMKMKSPHIVPLSRQALNILKELKEFSGTEKFIFTNEHNPVKFMSENTILYALYRMGYRSRATGHGFRSTASTTLNEEGFNRDAIERQLAHSERNSVRAAYNYAEYLPERRKMMQWWADFLDTAEKKQPTSKKRFKTDC